MSHTNDKSTPSDYPKSPSPKQDNKITDIAKQIAAGVDDSTKGKDQQPDDKQSSIDRDRLESLENDHKPNKTHQGELAVDEHGWELDYINIPKICVAKKMDRVKEPDGSTIPIESPHTAKSTDSNNANIVTKSETVSSAPVKQHSLSTIDVQSDQSNECAESHSKEVVGGNTTKTHHNIGTESNAESNILHEDDMDTRVHQTKSATQSNARPDLSAITTASLEQTKW